MGTIKRPFSTGQYIPILAKTILKGPTDLTISNYWIQSVGPFKIVLAEVVAVEDMLDIVTKKRGNGC